MSAGDELVVGQRGGSDGAVDEAWDQGGELEATVVAPGEAGEIAAGVLGADVTVRASDRGLDVAQRGVDPLERRPPCRLLRIRPAGTALRKRGELGGSALRLV